MDYLLNMAGRQGLRRENLEIVKLINKDGTAVLLGNLRRDPAVRKAYLGM